MENYCRKVLFCDAEPVWRPVAGRYCYLMRSQGEELLKEDIVLLCGSSLENCCRKILFCDVELVWRTVGGRYCFVKRSQCGELVHEGIVM